MKKIILTAFALTVSFGLGFALNHVITNRSNNTKMKKVTGIGGIFFKCKDPEKMRELSKPHLGEEATAY